MVRLLTKDGKRYDFVSRDAIESRLAKRVTELQSKYADEDIKIWAINDSFLNYLPGAYAVYDRDTRRTRMTFRGIEVEIHPEMLDPAYMGTIHGVKVFSEGISEEEQKEQFLKLYKKGVM